MGIQERKQREKERRRQQISVAAKRVFAEKGFSKATMEDIAKDTENPGFKNIILCPALVKSVDWVKCDYKSPYGKIVSNWKIENGLFEYYQY